MESGNTGIFHKSPFPGSVGGIQLYTFCASLLSCQRSLCFRLLSLDGHMLFTTPQNYEVPVPSSFHINGILNQTAFKIAVVDQDQTIWCVPDDFMGDLTIPAATTGGTYQNTASSLTLRVYTHQVTSATFSYTVSVVGPDKPIVSCADDSLHSSYATDIQWFSADGTAQEHGSTQNFKPNTVGNYYVEYTSGPCPVHSCWITYPSCQVIAVHEQALLNRQMQLTPNPTAGPISISLPVVFYGDIDFSLFDLLGKRIMTQYQAIQPGETINFDLSAFPAGIYLLRANQPGRILQRQVIIQR